MRVGILSTYDTEGGAGRAAYRLHQGLLKSGVNSELCVLWKTSDDASVRAASGRLSKYAANLRIDIDRAPLLLYRERQKKFFSTGILPNAHARDFAKEVDVVNLHWLGAGFMGIKEISRVRVPMVLTLHDSWAFTGGCHVPGACLRYLKRCGQCPQLGSVGDADLSRYVISRKERYWKALKFSVVADGQWLAARASESSILAGRQIEVINPGLDLDVFKPIDKRVARTILGIRSNVKLVLFGAVGATSDENKGYSLLRAALGRLVETHPQEDIELAIFGGQAGVTPERGLRTHFFGTIRDTISLPILYSAADVMVVPSRQEAFGQTASESLACGTPVVAFDATGLKDSIDHMQNGFLATPFESNDLADGIAWVLADPERWERLSLNARMKAMRSFGLEGYAAKYLTVYEKALSTQ